MKLYEIDAGNFKLDGGAMYGVVPKTFWQKWNPADEDNLCTWKMRCLLIESGNQLILIDTGMGNKQDLKWQGYFKPHGDSNLITSIEKLGYKTDDLSDVVLSHLHFDHCGGAVSLKNGQLQPTFRFAKYWTHSEHWKWAIEPNSREKATFLKENIWPLMESRQLHFIDHSENPPFNNIEIITADGHTEKMIMPLITISNQKVLFVADTIPSASHVHIPYVMGYDVRPLTTMNEKKEILEKAVSENWILYYDHDPNYACSTIEITEKGFRASNLGHLNDFGL
jgi:glyoxylase-like metal-dependent hydrolase (beta-lactamase superfamily II)